MWCGTNMGNRYFKSSLSRNKDSKRLKVMSITVRFVMMILKDLHIQ